MLREIVHIDEQLCDGCGLCVPSCAEGALQIINGKAKLIADKLCDGMGACLGHCPRGAIKIENREAPAFDEAAVAQHLRAVDGSGRNKPLFQVIAAAHTGAEHAAAGCPGSSFMALAASTHRAKSTESGGRASQESELRHWPVQLRLLSPHAPVLKNARLLVCADCVPVAYADFHQNLLCGRAVVIGCPKFDDNNEAVERLAQIIALNELEEVAVARMTVPCCMGIMHAVLEARRLAGSSVPVTEIIVDQRGELTERLIG